MVMLDSTENHAAMAIEFVPNPACKHRPVTDTQLLQLAMDRMKVIADENHRLRTAITAVASANESDFNATLAAAIDLATGPLPYTLADFLPAFRQIHMSKEAS
jgi:hypothetical protein